MLFIEQNRGVDATPTGLWLKAQGCCTRLPWVSVGAIQPTPTGLRLKAQGCCTRLPWVMVRAIRPTPTGLWPGRVSPRHIAHPIPTRVSETAREVHPEN